MGKRSLSRREITNLIGKNVLFYNNDFNESYIGEVISIVENEEERKIDKNGFDVKIKVLAVNSFPLPGKANFRFSEYKWETCFPIPHEVEAVVNRMFVESYRIEFADYEESYKKALNMLLKDLITLYNKEEGIELSDAEYRLQNHYENDKEIEKAIRCLSFMKNIKYPDSLTIIPNYNTLGYRLKMAREKMGYTSDNVYNLIRVWESDLKKIENDMFDPPTELLAKLSDIYDVSIDWLITGEEFKTQQEKMHEAYSEHWKRKAEEYETKYTELSVAVNTMIELASRK